MSNQGMAVKCDKQAKCTDERSGIHSREESSPENYYDGIMQLQRTIGNHAVYRMLRDDSAASEPVQKKENNTGLPDKLKSGVENLSGISMDGVRVHYNSSKPAEVGALAYTQGRNIYMGAGQEKHLPHEAWHVVQQAQRRVKPTLQAKGLPVNDDGGLEREADVMGQQLRKYDLQKGQSHDSKPYRRELYNTVANLTQVQSYPIQCTLAQIYDPNVYKLETKIDQNNLAEGLGAKTTGGKDLKTKIKWGDVHPETGEGTSVECEILGPDHPLGSQTGKGSGITERVKGFNKVFSGSWKEGHILNAFLGGPGDEARNLIAITASTNSKMFYDFEDTLKKNINIEGKWMHYKAEVEHKQISKGKRGEVKRGLDDDDLYWANQMNVSFGFIDEDGNKTDKTTKIKMDMPEPDFKKNKKAESKTEEEDTKNSNAGAVTEIGTSDVILTDLKTIKEDVEKKVEENFSSAISGNLGNLGALSPMRVEEVDDEMQSEYTEFQPASKLLREGKPPLSYYHLNRDTGRKNRVKFVGKYVKSYAAAARKNAYDYPGKLFNEIKKLIIKKDTAADAKKDTAADAKKQLTKDILDKNTELAKYKDLHETVCRAIPWIADSMGQKDFKRLTNDFYVTNPKEYQNYYMEFSKYKSSEYFILSIDTEL